MDGEWNVLIGEGFECGFGNKVLARAKHAS
jgi:hypothetical protein